MRLLRLAAGPVAGTHRRGARHRHVDRPHGLAAGLRRRPRRADGRGCRCRAGRRRTRGRRHSAIADGTRTGPHRPERTARGADHARAQAADGRAQRRLPGPARRHRHDGRAVRGLDLAPAGLPRQAGRPAQHRGLLRQAAGLRRRHGRCRLRAAGAARIAAGGCAGAAAAAATGFARRRRDCAGRLLDRPRPRPRRSRRCGCAPPAPPA